MKKNTIKAFTLVEMLIVIVIIGILIAALMPRMQAAQWRARDVSRKTALSQIQTAIVTYQWDKWYWPGDEKDPIQTWGDKWLTVDKIKTQLQTAWMNWVPNDPINAHPTWLWSGHLIMWETWFYTYMITTRNWTPKWWFVLMAKTEVEWWSNRVTCTNDYTTWHGWIPEGTDVSAIHLCDNLTQSWNNSNDCNNDWNWNCWYGDDSSLRYIVTY